jgi:hypothetical protein
MLRNASKFGLLAVLMVTLCAGQQTAVQKEGGFWTSVVNGSFSGVRNLRIKVAFGTVKVQGSSVPGISYVIRNKSYESSEERARREFESYKLSTYTRADTAWIVGEWQSGREQKFSSEVTVSVPRDMELVKIETEGGAVVATGISGRLEAASAGGGIHVDDIGGAIKAETAGGAIDVGNVGGDLTVRTGGGNIHIGSVKGRVTAESGGGNLVLTSASQEAFLQTGGGNIHVDRCQGKLKAETGGGSIDAGEIGGGVVMQTGGGSLKIGSASGPVNAETGGGSIDLWGVPSAHVQTGAGAITAKFVASTERMDSVLETGVGDITIYLMPNVNLTVRANIEASSGHTISSDFPQIKVTTEGGPWGPKLVSAEGNLNGGGPVLKARTTMGNIYIRRAQ